MSGSGSGRAYWHQMQATTIELDTARFTPLQRLYGRVPFRRLRFRLLKDAPTRLTYFIRCGEGPWESIEKPYGTRDESTYEADCPKCGTFFMRKTFGGKEGEE